MDAFRKRQDKSVRGEGGRVRSRDLPCTKQPAVADSLCLSERTRGKQPPLNVISQRCSKACTECTDEGKCFAEGVCVGAHKLVCIY